MEHKIEDLAIRGLFLLKDCEKPFLKEWTNFKKDLKAWQNELVSEFEQMIMFGFNNISKTTFESLNDFILALVHKWQKRHPEFADDFDAIFLISAIENLFHKVLEKQNASFLEHQAIQIFFTRILDKVLRTQQLEYQDDKWLRTILNLRAVPSDWLAIIRNEKSQYKVSKVVCTDALSANEQLIAMCEGLQADNPGDLSVALSRLLTPGQQSPQIITVPCITETLLICVKEQADTITEEQKETLRKMYLKQMKLNHLESELEWKDASLLFQQRLIHSQSATDAVKMITQGLVDYLPFSRCALFIYSPGEHSGVGVHAHNVNTGSVQHIKESIADFPLLTKYLKLFSHSKPIFIEDAAEILPEKYIRDYSLKSLVVLPIYVPAENKLIGLALLDRGENTAFTVNNQTLTALIKFGQYGGELLNQYYEDAVHLFGVQRAVLTIREREVLKLVAEGASINEAADALHLSSYTVRDYISAIIQKLDAKNRTDAAVKALKMRLIQ
ncbi:LuxR C-terminal-related transcriptional regulator [Mesobacillus subterraneus]|uniref:response regulator transcription factor n=1 Tax=Mesobacillus subterraneus TaxID=285983 RepID=UPI00203B3440|nr:LuxR C-terminal-related transcriptional regulator [Mesobacillus subterraneus]MCM3665293.1 LuxR C-terminal-related transcriptional regulator [Mesobacillus subterraneus]MCM3684306.1 LuxR C-terminal-related transcriptional regulator [Mesobacillus subterraneus]